MRFSTHSNNIVLILKSVAMFFDKITIPIHILIKIRLLPSCFSVENVHDVTDVVVFSLAPFLNVKIITCIHSFILPANITIDL